MIRRHRQSFQSLSGRVCFKGFSPYVRAMKVVRPHSRWLAAQSFAHPTHHIVLAEYIQAIGDAGVPLERLTKQVAETAAFWTLAPIFEAYQASRESRQDRKGLQAT